MSNSKWTPLDPTSPELFEQLRALDHPEASIRFGIGTEGRHRVAVPAARLVLQGRLRLEADVDRFSVEIEGWGPADFAWLARRKGRGRPDYWQGAVEHRATDRPALVFYFTAPLSGIEISVRQINPPD